MANPYFQFKHFTIHQDQCAMKVCTDACILGAWFSQKIADYSMILDIGSGTGLLMMMLAQRSESEIHGIEIDLPSFKQLKENISQNKWKERLRVFPGDAKNYRFPNSYDFIIANPPFYENDLESEAENEQVAMHSKKLTLEELVEVIDRNLEADGSFGVLLPYHRTAYFQTLAETKKFHLLETLTVRHSAKHEPFRSIVYYGRYRENFVPQNELIIQQEDGFYTPEFRELLKDYYLYL